MAIRAQILGVSVCLFLVGCNDGGGDRLSESASASASASVTATATATATATDTSSTASASEGETESAGTGTATGTGTGAPTTTAATDTGTTTPVDETMTGSGTTAGTTAGTTDGTTGPVDDRLCPEHPATDACCCFAEAEQFEDYTENVCPTQPLCDTIQVLCDDFKLDTCAVDQLTTNSDAAIDCALQALVDGGVGSIEWSVSGTINPGQSGHQALLITVGDGTAFRTGYSYFDLGASVEAVARFMLPPKEFFLDCLTRPTAAERFVCLREGRIGMTIEGCLAAYDADYF